MGNPSVSSSITQIWLRFSRRQRESLFPSPPYCQQLLLNVSLFDCFVYHRLVMPSFLLCGTNLSVNLFMSYGLWQELIPFIVAAGGFHEENRMSFILLGKIEKSSCNWSQVTFKVTLRPSAVEESSSVSWWTKKYFYFQTVCSQEDGNFPVTPNLAIKMYQCCINRIHPQLNISLNLLGLPIESWGLVSHEWARKSLWDHKFPWQDDSSLNCQFSFIFHVGKLKKGTPVLPVQWWKNKGNGFTGGVVGPLYPWIIETVDVGSADIGMHLYFKL